MNFNNQLIKLCRIKVHLVLILFLIINNSSFGQVTNLDTGLWSNPALWTNGRVPTSRDSVYLSFGVSVDVSAICKSLNVNENNLTVDSGATLNILNNPIDIDSNEYNAVAICSQVWMRENLKTTRYRNGDLIPEVANPSEWANLTTGAWCYNNNDPNNHSEFGKLYNWYAVNDPRGLAPEGWHIPSSTEWATLSNCLGGNTLAGGKLKDTTIWNSVNVGATNSSGFSGLPGGYRYPNGTYCCLTYQGAWWTRTEPFPGSIVMRQLSYHTAEFLIYGYTPRAGLAVRCVKD